MLRAVPSRFRCPEQQMCDAGPDHSACLTLKQQAADSFSSGRLDQATSQLTAAIRACPASHTQLLATLYCNRSACHAEAGAWTQALVDGKVAARHRPSWHKPYLRQAMALSALERYDEAVHALDAGILACSTTQPAAGDDTEPAGQPPPVLPEGKLGNGGSEIAPAAGERLDGQASQGVQELKEVRDTLAAAAAAAARASKRRRLLAPPAPDPASEALRLLRSAGVQPQAVPVTVVSGFLGAGKTTLLRHLLTCIQQGGGKLGQGRDEGDRQQQGCAHQQGLEAEQDTGQQQQKQQQQEQHPQLLHQGEVHHDAPSPHPSDPDTNDAAFKGRRWPWSDGAGPSASSRAPLVGVLVNDLADVNIDAELLSNILPPQPHPRQGQEPEAPSDVAAPLASTRAPSAAQGGGADTAAASGPLLTGTPPVRAMAQPDQNGHGPAYAAPRSPPPPSSVPPSVPPPAAAPQLVELHGGCICCNLKGDMLLSIAQLLVQQPGLGLLLVESTGVGDPMPVAATLQVLQQAGYIAVDTLVTVADVCQLAAELGTTGAASHSTSAGQPGVRALGELLAQQVEYASVVVLNKCDLAAAAAAGGDGEALVCSVEAAVAALAPRARIVRAVQCRVEARQVLWTGLFDAGRMEESARWQRELLEAEGLDTLGDVEDDQGNQLANRGQGSTVDRVGVPGADTGRSSPPALRSEAARGPPQDAVEAEAPCAPGAEHNGGVAAKSRSEEEVVYGIDSITFASRRPFHPARLWSLLWGSHHAQAPLASSQGKAAPQASSCTHPPCTFPPTSTGQVGPASLPQGLLRSKGFFWVAGLPQVAWEWSTAGSSKHATPYGEWLAGRLPRHLWPKDRRGWEGSWGDRKQLLVFIGRGLDGGVLQAQLEACLVTEEEEQELMREDGAAMQDRGAEGIELQEGVTLGEVEAQGGWEQLARPWKSLMAGSEQSGRCY